MTAQTSPDLPDSPQRQTKPAADGAPTLGAVLSDALMCSRFCPRDDTCDHDVTCDDLEDAEWERIAGVVAERVHAEMTADRDDWKARCEQAWTQLDQAQADLAAMTARAHTAEAEQWRAGYHAAADEMRGVHQRTGSPAADWAAAYLNGQASYVEQRARAAVRGRDETGPQTAPSSPRSAQQATVEGSDAGSSQGGSGGAA